MVGGDEIDAETSSMEPKVTADPEENVSNRNNIDSDSQPCFTAPTLLRGTLTPSFMGTP